MKNAIDCFFGSPLEIESEKVFLAKLKTDLSSCGESALIFANFYTPKDLHQIDFLVITSHCACHIELKTFTAPVIGAVNGLWSLIRPNGVAVPHEAKNPYHQALHCKQAISDEMHLFAKRDRTIPGMAQGEKFFKHIGCVVCVYPELLPTSSVPSDFKVRVCGYPDLLRLLTTAGKTPPGWSHQTWLSFAMYLRLTRSDEVEEKIPQDLKAAQLAMDEYRHRLALYLKHDLQPLIPTAVQCEGTARSIEAVTETIVSGRDLQLTGKSGGGKTLLMKHLALRVLEMGRSPVILSAIDYSGKLSTLFDRGIAHIHPETGMNLLQAAQRSKTPLLLIIDGFNECPQGYRDALVKDIKAFSLRWNVPILITAQEFVRLGDGHESAHFEIAPPSAQERLEILQAYHDGKVSEEFVEICAPFQTPYELSLAAAYSLPETHLVTRAGLFDAYVSRRCEATTDAILVRGILGTIAANMQDSHKSSLSLTEARRDSLRYLTKQGGRTRLFNEALKCGLLTVQQNRCTFKHEMLERFFQAEMLIQSQNSTEELAQTLALPKNHPVAEFVLGLETDHTTLKRCLEALADHNTIHSCLSGRFGADAEEVATADCLRMLCKARSALDETDVELFTHDYGISEFRLTEGPSWTKYEIALMNATGKMLPEGQFVEEVLDLTRATDELWLDQLTNKSNRNRLTLREADDTFASIYSLTSSASGFFPISVIHQASRFRRFDCGFLRINETIRDMIANPAALSPGEKAFLCEVLKQPRPEFAPFVPGVLEVCLKTKLYRLQIMATDMIQYWGATLEAELLAMTVKLLESYLSDTNIMINTAVFDALSALGQLEPFVTVEEVTAQIETILSDRNSEENSKWAYSTVTNIVDGPNSEIYWEAIHSLPKEKFAQIFTMAALGTDSSFFLDWILNYLIKAEDEVTLPAFLRWANPPRRHDSSPQMATSSYLLAMVGCSRYLKVPPTMNLEDSGDSQAWAAYGEIVFWMSHSTVTPAERMEYCKPLWERLTSELLFEAVDPLYRFEDASRTIQKQGITILAQICVNFPEEVRSILEFGLKHQDKVSSLFHKFRDTDLPIFIIQQLGQVGGRTSVKLLEGYCDAPEFGRFAIESLRSLNAKSDGR